MAATITPVNTPMVCRSANYEPSIWHYDYLQSLDSKYKEESYAKRSDMLKKKVKMMLEKIENPLHQLELIDVLQRLGLSYHFEDEIKRILKSIHVDYFIDEWRRTNLYATGLAFRLFRQDGYNIPIDVFSNFHDEMGKFKKCIIEDIGGMLSLYEASYLSVEGETLLDEARNFTLEHLKSLVNKNKDDYISLLVDHAFEFPLHWRPPRVEARWFIDTYERKNDMNPIILELGKLDYNIVQAIHQEELKDSSRWWKGAGVAQKYSFARDRLMESYLWQPGLSFEPEFGYFRRVSTKLYAIMTILDDVYDVYGTSEELQLLTDAFDRWDTDAMDTLPDYMKLLFLVIYNYVNEMGYDTLRDQGFNVIPCLKKYWSELCHAYLMEAKRNHSGYKPTLQVYIDNAWISIGVPVAMVHTYFAIANPITKEALECLEKQCPDIIRWTSMMVRFADDLGTFSREKEVGDSSNSIEYYMNETGASEDEARKHIRCLMYELWKKINRDRFASSLFSQTFTQVCVNFARMAHRMYQNGDGHTCQKPDIKDLISSLFIELIPLNDTLSSDS